MSQRGLSAEELEMALRLIAAIKGESAAPRLQQLVTLDQMAALVRRSKHTLRNYASRPPGDPYRLPDPAVEGGGGRPHLYDYATVRPWLTLTFHVQLPEQFPGIV